MELTISLDEPVAARLRLRAAQERRSPEESAKAMLAALLESLAADESWPALNERRHGLIEKKFAGGLAADEEAELARLQAVAAERVAPLDRLMIARVEEALRRAKGLPDDPSP
ncbi:MAG: hypothetical protein K2W96_21630 [Gemmataceae bacterium]|nr:hypothetical protein [Gemmataceae bacterium]